jgi:uncharacterized membrane protein
VRAIQSLFLVLAVLAVAVVLPVAAAGAQDTMLPWTYRAAGDFTVLLAVRSPQSNESYNWTLGNTTIGAGSVIEHQFDRSGTYNVALVVMTTNTTETFSGEVVVEPSSFLAQNLPILLLVVIAVWYTISLLASTPSDAGRWAMSSVMVFAFAAAIYMADARDFTTFSLLGPTAIQVYGATIAILLGTVIRYRLIALGMFVLGVVLLTSVYLSLGVLP